MVNNRELKKAKEAIETLLSFGIYPEEYLVFFFYWSLFNFYYGLSVPKGGDRDKILSFGRQHSTLWNNAIEVNARRLVALECVGDGRGENAPSSYVKAATNQLRDLLGVPKEQICSRCRPPKRDQCSRVEEEGKFECLKALLRIIYQIRCNFVHGDKIELTGEQGERNKELVKLANPIIEEILRNL